MNNSYYIYYQKHINYTINKNYAMPNIQNIAISNDEILEPWPIDNKNYYTMGPTQSKYHVDLNKIETPEHITMIKLLKTSRKDIAFVQHVNLMTDPEDNTENMRTRQGISVTNNTINYQPGQKALQKKIDGDPYKSEAMKVYYIP